MNIPQILDPNTRLVDAARMARESNLRLCMNKDGRVALLPAPRHGWYQVGKLARRVDNIMEAA